MSFLDLISLVCSFKVESVGRLQAWSDGSKEAIKGVWIMCYVNIAYTLKGHWNYMFWKGLWIHAVIIILMVF